ncbi:MAG TPA: dTMP kinase [Dehalococcoidia bacterium]
MERADGGRTAGIFVTLEGGEGSGKSSQARALEARLRASGRAVTVTREPGGTDLGEVVRQVIRKPALARRVFSGLTDSVTWSGVTPLAELFLFEAARAQLVAEVVRPALAAGAVVLSDRFTDSTLAYQGYGRGLDLELVRTVNGYAAAGVTPDLTVLLDVPVEVGLARKAGEAGVDAIGREALAFHQRVRRGYLALAAAEPERWLVVDAAAPPERVTEAIWARLAPLLAARA